MYLHIYVCAHTLCLIHCEAMQCVALIWHESFTCETWLVHMWDMTQAYVCILHSGAWHVPFTCVTWFFRMCDMTHSYVRHDSFTCVTWLILICDMTYLYVCTQQTRQAHNMTHTHVQHDAYTRVPWFMRASHRFLDRLSVLQCVAACCCSAFHDSYPTKSWGTWHYAYTCEPWLIYPCLPWRIHVPLTEEIRLQIFGSPDQSSCPWHTFEPRGLRLLT